MEVTEACMARSAGIAQDGYCFTMACMVESLGLSYPNAAIPAADSRRKVLFQLSGIRDKW